MSKLRLTKEQKKMRKKLVKYHRNLQANKEARKAARKIGIGAIMIALAIHELIKGKD